MLSCQSRFSNPQIRSSAADARQSLSAIKVRSLTSQDAHEEPVLLPWIPYAVSLTLSIAYLEMRHSKVAMYQVRARRDLHSACCILKGLGETFWSAAVMSEMGNSLMQEMERVVATASLPRQFREADGGSTEEILRPDTAGRQEAEASQNEASGLSNGAFHDQGSQNQDLGALDFNSAQDFDVFGMFDPEFDLEGIDSFFGNNLDLSIPTSFM